MEMNFTQLTLGQGGWDTQKVDKFAEAVKKDHNKENDKLGDILSGFGQWGKENKQGNMGDYIQSLDKDTKADYQSFLGLDASNKPKEGAKGLGVHVGEGNYGTKYITMTQGKVEKGGMQTSEDTEASRLQEDVEFSNVVDERHIAGKTATDLERNNDMHIITDTNTDPKALGQKASPDAGSFARPVAKKDTTSEAGTATKPAKLGQDAIGAPQAGEVPGQTKNPDGSLKEFVDPKAAAELEQQNKDLDAATRSSKAEPKAAVKPGTTTPAFGAVTAKTTAPASTQGKTDTKAPATVAENDPNQSGPATKRLSQDQQTQIEDQLSPQELADLEEARKQDEIARNKQIAARAQEKPAAAPAQAKEEKTTTTASTTVASNDPNQQGPATTDEELSANARTQLNPKEQVALDKAHVEDAKAQTSTETKPEGKKGKGLEDMDFNELIKMKIVMDMFGGGNNGGNNGGGMGSNPLGMLLAAKMLGIDPKELGLAGGNAQAPGMGNDERYGTNAPSAFQRGGIISALNLDGYKDTKGYKQTQYDNARNDADRYAAEAKNGKAGWFTRTFFGRTDEDVQEAAAKKRDAALEKAASIDVALHPVTADTNA